MEIRVVIEIKESCFERWIYPKNYFYLFIDKRREFTIWNARGINKKVEKLGLNFVALTESKKKGTGTIITGDSVHIYTGVPKEEKSAAYINKMKYFYIGNEAMNTEREKKKPLT